MKKIVLALLLSAATALSAQDSPKTDAFTSQGAHAISVNGSLNAGANSKGFSSYTEGRVGYEYFLKNGWSISADIFNQSSFDVYSQNKIHISADTRFDAGLHTRYYFGTGKFLPYRWLYVEAGARTLKSAYLTSSQTVQKFNTLALTVGAGAQIKIKNNWFADVYMGYNIHRYPNSPLNYADLTPRLGLTYRIPSSSKK